MDIYSTVNVLRRAVEMPGVDQGYLEAEGCVWETIVDGGINWFILHDFAIPEGYSSDIANAAFMIPPGYPDIQLDMVYFYPSLQRRDGKQIANITDQQLDGKIYQRWSRHRTTENPWRPGDDCLATHVLQVKEWLSKELRKG
jgi:hypothetical protein